MSSVPLFPPSTALTTRAQFLDAYEAIDVIGNGSFGVIRKVRRKEDGAIYARKELNFERMSDRDKKQIVAEVNILKDLNHENIVRYHDRFVDSDNGMLYIVMEYCGGGDLGSVISSTKKRGQSIPEDTVWDYFLQIVLALHHCHAPHIKPGTNEVLPNVVKRAPILHRDIKPENVFLDANGVVKLGDFGLSKQLGTQAFTNTYVGTPYYMSPELFGEMHYDTKSDIWSLGCLVYELCALNPPFHEAQTHAELATYVKKGRVPTLPGQYGHYLQAAIKAMMSLEPSKRPSAAHLLAHERMNLAFKTRETQEMLNKVVGHRQTLHARQERLEKREQDLARREQALALKEQEFAALAVTKEAEIMGRVAAREEELRQWVFTREAELKKEMIIQEEATQQAVAAREVELEHMWNEREALLRAEIARKDAEIAEREDTLKREAERLHRERMSSASFKSTPTEDDTDATPVKPRARTSLPHASAFETPAPATSIPDDGGSAMKGVIMADGQVVATPVVAQLRQLLTDSPSKRIDLIHVLDQQSSSSPLHDAVVALDDGEKENSPPDATGPPSPSAVSTTSSRSTLGWEDKTPQPRIKRRTSGRADDLTAQLKATNPSLASVQTGGAKARGMQRTMSAPVGWGTEDGDDDVPSPFLKRTDRAMAKMATMGVGNSVLPVRGPALERKPSKSGLKEGGVSGRLSGGRLSAGKATTIKSSASATGSGSRISIGKGISRTVSSKP